MKHSSVFLFVALCVLVLVSCDERYVSTPGLQTSSYLIRTSAAGVTDTISFMDTLQVNDTVLMGVAAFGNYNNLTGLVARADTSCVQLGFVWNHEGDTFLLNSSEPEHGILYFVPQQVNVCVTTLRYIPRKSGTHRVEFVVSSDAGGEYSPREFYFNTVVR